MQRSPVSQSKWGWRQLYLAALFEADRDKLPERIAEAENALVLRARELFQTTGDHIEQKRTTLCVLFTRFGTDFSIRG
jgi:hypothetical protein